MVSAMLFAGPNAGIRSAPGICVDVRAGCARVVLGDRAPLWPGDRQRCRDVRNAARTFDPRFGAGTTVVAGADRTLVRHGRWARARPILSVCAADRRSRWENNHPRL